MNKYVIYIEGLSFGPFTTGVRGKFEWKLKTKKDKSMADSLVSYLRHGLKPVLVDISGSVLNVNCNFSKVNIIKGVLELNLYGGDGL